MFITLFQIHLFPWFGIFGAVVITLASIAAGSVYRGKSEERYSVFNHFISELGEVQVSRLAALFNLGLILCGVSFVIFSIGLGFNLSTLWGWLAAGAGVWAGSSCALVGLNPMDNLDPHMKAAMSFFRSGLVTMLLFGMAFVLQREGSQLLSPWMSLLSLIGAAVYGAFLLRMGKPREDAEDLEEPALDPDAIEERPRFWLIAILEWAIFFVTIFWFLGVALGILL